MVTVFASEPESEEESDESDSDEEDEDAATFRFFCTSLTSFGFEVSDSEDDDEVVP